MIRPQDAYPEVRGVAPDLLVYFGDLAWRSVGQVGTGEIFTYENDTGPDGANHDRTGVFVMAGLPGQPTGRRRGAVAGGPGPLDPVPVRNRPARGGGGKEFPVSEQKGFTVWFTGLSGAGKSTLAEMLFHELRVREMRVEILDGDVVRTNLSKGLGFSREDRDTNILRIGFVANLLTRNGVATIVSAVSPYRDARAQCRSAIKDFVEIYVHATVDECAKRDVKGLYEKARAGQIKGFTGVDDPYEEPQSPEIYIDTMVEQPDGSLDKILNSLVEYGYIASAERLVHAGGEHSGMTDLDGAIGQHLAGQHSVSPGEAGANGRQESAERKS